MARDSRDEKETAKQGSRSRLKRRERDELGSFAADNEEGNYARGDYRWRNGGPKPAVKENWKPRG